MSYHNGTIWPHDCSIVAASIGRYDMKEQTRGILTGLVDRV